MTKRILIAVAFSLIPSFLLFAGKTDYVFNWCVNHAVIFTNSTKVEDYKFWSFLLGILVSGGWLPVQLAVLKSDLANTKNKFQKFVEYNKQLQIDTLCSDIKAHNHPFSTRVFIPKTDFFSVFKKKENKKYKLNLKEINGISDNHHTKVLSFKVDGKTTEGLVGKAFKERAIVIDFDVSNNNTYQLTNAQKIKVGDVNFCSAIPIFDKKENIIAVLSVDSTEMIQRDDERLRYFEKFLRYYASFIDKNNLLS